MATSSLPPTSSPAPPSRLRTALRWLQAALGGAAVAAGVTAALAVLVQHAGSAPVSDPDPVPVASAACGEGFALVGAQPVHLATRVGYQPWPGGGFAPIAGAELFELHAGLESAPHQEERRVAITDLDGALEFVWERRFSDEYACGALTSAWKQSTHLYALRAPGCAERTIVVTDRWAPPELLLECEDRTVPFGRWL
jgi:hypothetical protein